MPKETFDVEKIRALALTADDLWMKVMSIHGGVPVVKSQTRCKALCMAQQTELDYLIYNDPLGYADLILNGDPEGYLKNVTGSHGLED